VAVLAAAAAVVGALGLLPAGRVWPPAEQAWNALAATCTPGTAAVYRGVVPDVRPDTGTRTVITVHPAGVVPLTLAYDRPRTRGAAGRPPWPPPPGRPRPHRRPAPSVRQGQTRTPLRLQ